MTNSLIDLLWWTLGMSNGPNPDQTGPKTKNREFSYPKTGPFLDVRVRVRSGPVSGTKPGFGFWTELGFEIGTMRDFT